MDKQTKCNGHCGHVPVRRAHKH